MHLKSTGVDRNGQPPSAQMFTTPPPPPIFSGSHRSRGDDWHRQTTIPLLFAALVAVRPGGGRHGAARVLRRARPAGGGPSRRAGEQCRPCWCWRYRRHYHRPERDREGVFDRYEHRRIQPDQCRDRRWASALVDRESRGLDLVFDDECDGRPDSRRRGNHPVESDCAVRRDEYLHRADKHVTR